MACSKPACFTPVAAVPTTPVYALWRGRIQQKIGVLLQVRYPSPTIKLTWLFYPATSITSGNTSSGCERCRAVSIIPPKFLRSDDPIMRECKAPAIRLQAQLPRLYQRVRMAWPAALLSPPVLSPQRRKQAKLALGSRAYAVLIPLLSRRAVRVSSGSCGPRWMTAANSCHSHQADCAAAALSPSSRRGIRTGSPLTHRRGRRSKFPPQIGQRCSIAAHGARRAIFALAAVLLVRRLWGEFKQTSEKSHRILSKLLFDRAFCRFRASQFSAHSKAGFSGDAASPHEMHYPLVRQEPSLS
jgi:hypothetical protein